MMQTLSIDRTEVLVEPVQSLTDHYGYWHVMAGIFHDVFFICRWCAEQIKKWSGRSIIAKVGIESAVELQDGCGDSRQIVDHVYF